MSERQVETPFQFVAEVARVVELGGVELEMNVEVADVGDGSSP